MIDNLQLRADGAELRRAGALPVIDEVAQALASLPSDKAGVRLRGITRLTPHLLIDGTIGRLVTEFLGQDAKPVRAILFDKSGETNWSLGWHQDRTICVRERIDTPGFGPWTIKQGLQHVAPPFALLARMLTVRVHLDDVPDTNAPLLIAPGSHLLGLVPEGEVESAVERAGTLACLASRGDVWLYSTPILHASARAEHPARRRVLQIDYSADSLTNGLEWLGI